MSLHVGYEPRLEPVEDPADDFTECSGCGFSYEASDLIPHGSGVFCVANGCSLKALLDDAPADLSTWPTASLVTAREQTTQLAAVIDLEMKRRAS